MYSLYEGMKLCKTYKRIRPLYYSAPGDMHKYSKSGQVDHISTVARKLAHTAEVQTMTR